jgi:hypothetical protein
MHDLELGDAEALLAAVFGAVKWHERQHADGRHLGDAVMCIENALASLAAHFRDEQEPELPFVRAA